MKQVTHIYFERWEPDFKEFIRNIRSRNLIMKNEKESVQNSPLALLIGREIVFGAFKSEIFLLLSEKFNESEYSYQSWSPEFYGRTSKSDSTNKILFMILPSTKNNFNQEDQPIEEESKYYHQSKC